MTARELLERNSLSATVALHRDAARGARGERITCARREAAREEGVERGRTVTIQHAQRFVVRRRDLALLDLIH